MRLSDVQKPLGLACLVSIMTLAFFCRLMSNIRYETVIHEFDPYFQFKSTIKLMEDGDEEFSDWMDDMTWYPLSRYMLPTMYPGLMYTARFFIQVCNFIKMPISTLQACAYMGPVMSIVGAFFSYDFGKMVDESEQTQVLTGIISALLFSIIPGFIQRSVAGSYDNESNSITAMVAGFDLWLRACGCAYKGTKKPPVSGITPIIAALALFYMGISWGGFVFIICLVPLHVFICMISKSLNNRIKVAYIIWMPVSYLLLNMVWREYGFVFKQSIALPGIGVFCLMAQSELLGQINKLLSVKSRAVFRKYYISAIFFIAVGSIPILAQIGLLSKITGRFLSFLSPTHARKHNPLVASVSEHQPTVWTSFYFNTWMLPLLLPVGYYYGLAIRRSTGSLFMCIYLTTTTWFSAVMSRMILMASPAAAACGGYVISKILQTITSVNATQEFVPVMEYNEISQAFKNKSQRSKKQNSNQTEQSSIVSNEYITNVQKIFLIGAILGFILTFLATFTNHSLYAAKYYYSNPSVVMIGGQDAQGRPRYIDDFRETYRWLQHATSPSANVASWWDYMYQLNQMSARTTFVDNNTRSPYWIGLMGAILSSNEHVAWRISQDLGVDYVMAVSGAASGFNGDDIGKFMWPVRISANNRFWERQGYEYFKQYNEYNYYSNGHYLLNEQASYSMKNSMMYKLVYSGLIENTGNQFDHAHRSRIDTAYADRLNLFQEAYSSERMIVRIYKVRDCYNF